MKPKVGPGLLAVCLTLISLAGLCLFLLWVWGELGTEHLLAGILMACLPVPVYVGLVLMIDRFEPEPPSLLASAFLWGACLAVLLSYLLNTFNLKLFYHDTGSLGTAYVLAGMVSAPLVEELSKGLFLFALVYFRGKDFDGVLDGVVYATMVALGFAMAENIQYYGYSLHAGEAGSTFLLRGVLTPFIHPLFTCMTGIGLGQVCEGQAGKWRAGLGLALAMTLHSIWNFTAMIHSGLWLTSCLLIMLPCALAVGGSVWQALERESGYLRLYLKREIPGVRELGEVSSIFGRLAIPLRFALRLDFQRWKLSHQYLRTASELAFLRHRRAHRGLQPEVGEEEAVRDRLHQMIGKLGGQFARPSDSF